MSKQEDTKTSTAIDTATLDRWAATHRLAALYRAATDNAEDPWFLERVNLYVQKGFYFATSIETTGLYNPDPDTWIWIEPGDDRAVERAWLNAATAYKQGYRVSERGY